MPALTVAEIEAIIEKRAAEVEEVEVPEWGGAVCIRRMSPADVEYVGLDDPDKRDAAMFARAMSRTISDEKGELLFTEESAAVLAKVDMLVAARVFADIMRVNGLLDEQLEEAVATFVRAQPEPSSTS